MTRLPRVVALTGLAALLGAAVVAAQPPKPGLPRMGIDFTFEAKNKCDGVSPEVRLTRIPADTVTYDVTMKDLDVPTFHHWTQTMPGGGPVIREGAGTGYHGPCPPSGTHRYRIEVVARDRQNRPLAYGEKTVVTGR